MSHEKPALGRTRRLQRMLIEAVQWALLIGGTIAYHGVLLEHFG